LSLIVRETPGLLMAVVTFVVPDGGTAMAAWTPVFAGSGCGAENLLSGAESFAHDSLY
jgi:hypothetical protein